MPQVKGCRLVEVNARVADVESTRLFYEEAFEVEVVQDDHGDGHSHLQVVFGTWPHDEFFLLNFTPEDEPTSFGLLVDDLADAHSRAVQAGATELAPPRDLAGMPRTSCLRDPNGNTVNLYQG